MLPAFVYAGRKPRLPAASSPAIQLLTFSRSRARGVCVIVCRTVYGACRMVLPRLPRTTGLAAPRKGGIIHRLSSRPQSRRVKEAPGDEPGARCKANTLRSAAERRVAERCDALRGGAGRGAAARSDTLSADWRRQCRDNVLRQLRRWLSTNRISVKWRIEPLIERAEVTAACWSRESAPRSALPFSFKSRRA